MGKKLLIYHTYNKTGNVYIMLTLSSGSITTVAMEKQYVLHILSVCLYSCLIYPACKVQCIAVYCPPRPV